MDGFLKVFLVYLCLFQTSQMVASELSKEPIIIDCDADLDDMMAILYLLNTEKINLLAVTTTSNGKTHYEHGANNILKFLSHIKRKEILVSRSDKPPLEFNGYFPSEFRKQADAIYDLEIEETHLQPTETPSSDLLIEKILSSKQKVTILCTAPLTNLARALKKEPSIVNNIHKVFVIGGTINAKGNITEKHNGYYNRFAEYNFFLDGKAAEVVLKSGLNLTLIPLDVLETLTLINTELYRYLVKAERSVSANFIFNALSKLSYPYFGMNRSISFLGAIGAVLITNPEVGEVFPLKLKINLDYGPCYGMISIDREGVPADIYLKVNYELFFKAFIENIMK